MADGPRPAENSGVTQSTQSQNVVTGIHVQHVPRDPGGQIGAEKGRRVTDLLNGHITPQGGAFLHLLEHTAEVRDTGCGQGTDGTSGNGVYPSAFRTQGCGQIADIRLQARLGEAHHIVIGYGAYRPQVTHGQERTLASLHHPAPGLGQSGEAVGADIVGNGETLSGHGIDVFALELLPGREADRVHDGIESIPVCGQIPEGGLDLGVARHLQRQHDLRSAFGGQVLDAGFELLGLVGQGDVGPLAVHGLGDAIGDGAITGDAGDEDPFIL